MMHPARQAYVEEEQSEVRELLILPPYSAVAIFTASPRDSSSQGLGGGIRES